MKFLPSYCTNPNLLTFMVPNFKDQFQTFYVQQFASKLSCLVLNLSQPYVINCLIKIELNPEINN